MCAETGALVFFFFTYKLSCMKSPKSVNTAQKPNQTQPRPKITLVIKCFYIWDDSGNRTTIDNTNLK